MITIPKSNPARARLVVVAAGLATVLVSRFVPHEAQLLRDILTVLGIGGFFTGGVNIVQAPKHGGP